MGEIWGSFVGFMEQSLLWLAIFTGNTGLGIILFTAVVRLLILPLTLTSIRSSRRMQELQPMIKELQRKYGKDQRKLQEETVKLYQEYRINPLGGCLPMFLQLPIFIGVYWAVLHLMSPEYHAQLSPIVQEKIQDPAVKAILAQPFLTIDLGTKPFEEGFKHFQGVKYLIMPVLAISLQFVQQLMAMPRVQDPQQKAMSRAMMFMPLFFGYITLIFPAGAVLYWLTSSVIGIIQQYFTSGWGSLANHLKFLPPDKKSQVKPGTTEIVSSTSASASTSDTRSSASVAVAKPMDFWDVLRPLTEATVEDMGHGSTNTEESTERATHEVRQQGQKQTTNPRRSRRRR